MFLPAMHVHMLLNQDMISPAVWLRSRLDHSRMLLLPPPLLLRLLVISIYCQWFHIARERERERETERLGETSSVAPWSSVASCVPFSIRRHGLFLALCVLTEARREEGFVHYPPRSF